MVFGNRIIKINFSEGAGVMNVLVHTAEKRSIESDVPAVCYLSYSFIYI